MAVQVGFGKTCGIYLLVLFYVLPSILTDGQCVKKSPCRCEFDNGTGYDMSSTVKSSFYQADFIRIEKNKSLEIQSYFFNPCGDAKFKVNDNTTTENKCEDAPLSICRKVLKVRPSVNSSSTLEVVENQYQPSGYSKDTSFTNDGSAIIYTFGSSKVTILLTCTYTTDDDGNDLLIKRVSADQPNDYVLSFYTREACLKTFTVPHHTSLGSVIMIILFVMILTYLLLGMGTLYFSGARGIEIIPNLSFWVELPGLMRDGVSYLRNGCKLPPTTAMPDHYDSI